MVDDDVVQVCGIDHLGDLIDQGVALDVLRHIDQGALLAAFHDIGIVRDALTCDGPEALEEVGGPVIHTDPVDAGLHLYSSHMCLSLLLSLHIEHRSGCQAIGRKPRPAPTSWSP